MTTSPSPEFASEDQHLRWARAASLAAGQSFGPRAHGVPDPEASRIEELASRIDVRNIDEKESR